MNDLLSELTSEKMRAFTQRDVCAYQADRPENALQNTKLLNEKYVIGKVIRVDLTGIFYLAWSKEFEQAVIVRELFPQDCVKRVDKLIVQDEITWQIHQKKFHAEYLEIFLDEFTENGTLYHVFSYRAWEIKVFSNQLLQEIFEKNQEIEKLNSEINYLKNKQNNNININKKLIFDDIVTANKWLKNPTDDILNLNDLMEITPEVARIFAESHANLSLNRIRNITPEVAEILATANGWLYLNGLMDISPEIAEKLAKHKQRLFLNSVMNISLDVAKKLACHQGFLYLGGLTTITPEIAHALAGKKAGYLFVQNSHLPLINPQRRKLGLPLL